MFIERRKARRIEKNLLVRYREFDDAKWCDIAQIKDISELGLVIKTDKIFKVNSILHFRIKLPSNPFLWYEFDGRVVECGKYQLRIEIHKIEAVTKNVLHEYIEWYVNKQPPAQK